MIECLLQLSVGFHSARITSQRELILAEFPLVFARISSPAERCLGLPVGPCRAQWDVDT